MERTQELTEDINERAEVASQIAEEENNMEANSVEVSETPLETDES
jgi:hypothetical protein